MLTMTLEGLLLGLPKRPDGGRLQYRCAWRGSSDLAHRCRRVPLFICTNVAKNSADDRGITDQYSGGDREMRPKQEILFGVGSCQPIEVLGLDPSIFPRVKITRERRRLAAALDYVHIIPLRIMLQSLNAPRIVKDGTGMAGARDGARHRADWPSRIDLAGAGVRVEAVDAVGGGDPHVDSVVRTRVRPVGLAPGRCCIVRGFEPRSGPQ